MLRNFPFCACAQHFSYSICLTNLIKGFSSKERKADCIANADAGNFFVCSLFQKPHFRVYHQPKNSIYSRSSHVTVSLSRRSLRIRSVTRTRQLSENVTFSLIYRFCGGDCLLNLCVLFGLQIVNWFCLCPSFARAFRVSDVPVVRNRYKNYTE